MPNISDDLMGKVTNEAPGSLGSAGRAAKSAVVGTKDAVVGTGKTIYSGIVLILKGGKLTAEALMNSIGDMLAKNGKIEYSRNNTSMQNMYESGNVTKVSDAIQKDVMKYFDKHCKEHGVKYAVMKNTAEPDTYYVFFKSKQQELIHTILQESYRDYMNAQQQQQNKQQGKRPKQRNGREENEEKRDSVLAKLEFFRNRVKSRNKDAVEKHHKRSDRSR